jgi:CheY-like chemotaxis protein
MKSVIRRTFSPGTKRARKRYTRLDAVASILGQQRKEHHMRVAARRVLIVEDEDILADNLKAHLERASCDARVAGDGASAIHLMADFAPEVVVLDYRLPDMDGFEVLDAIRCRCSIAECVLITGHPTSEVYSGAAERGIRHILFKPFPLVELSKLVCADIPADGPAVRQPRASVQDSAPQDVPPAPLPERRHHAPSGFPMRLFDGSWLYADRRHPAQVRQGGKKREGN